MAEGLSAAEVGKQLGEHKKEADPEEETGSARVFTIIEAVLLAVVAVLAAWSGFASAKWGTESSLALARASATRTEANRADLNALSQKNFDASTFNAWFTAYTLNNQTAMTLAVRRFSPEFLVAFNSWSATDPATNPNAPKGPTYMPNYVQPGQAQSHRLDARADADYTSGEMAASNSDNYVRTTIFLAPVLFLVGISSHFRSQRCADRPRGCRWHHDVPGHRIARHCPKTQPLGPRSSESDVKGGPVVYCLAIATDRRSSGLIRCDWSLEPWSS